MPKTKEVEVKQIEASPDGELSKSYYRRCHFCDKLIKLGNRNASSCYRLSGKKFHCPFCLRNNFNNRSSRNVLPFSFRGIIGYYYYKLYLEDQTLWLSHIEQLIDKHVKVGMHSPVLSYDPSTFMWFADFNKIGSDGHKAPFDEVMLCVKGIFETFQISKLVGVYAEGDMWEKFEKAFKLYYEQRKRPKNKSKLIPTFSKCAPTEKHEFYEETREFLLSFMRLK